MRTILFTEALSYEGRRLAIVDLVLAGLLDGSWAGLEERAALGVGAERALDAAGPGPSREAVREAAHAFRYERRLLAREDLGAWLSERGLTVGDWRGHLRRGVAAGLAEAAEPGDPAPVLRVDALCSGTLLHCGREALAGAAATRALGRGELEADDGDVARLVARARATTASGLDALSDAELEPRARRAVALHAARTVLAEEVADTDAIERRLATHALDWLAFETEELEVADEHVAREARLCVDEDGATLAEVAGAAGAATAARTRLFADTDPELRARLVGAGAGELVGPVALDGGWLLARLLAKTPPSAADAATAGRARAELVAEVVERHSAGRAVWHVAL